MLQPQDDADELMVAFAQATEVRRLDSLTYTANFLEEYGVGTVPHGGYVASIFLKIASLHLGGRHQPDTLTAHFNFLSRTEYGPAVFAVEDAKPGRQVTVLHITLYQRALLPTAPWTTADGASRREVVAYVSNTDLSAESGVSLPTGYRLLPPPAPLGAATAAGAGGMRRLVEGEDEHWKQFAVPRHSFRHVFGAFDFYVPRRGWPRRSIIDLWARLSTGEMFTDASLAFVADAWPFPVESYRPGRPSGSTAVEAEGPASGAGWEGGASSSATPAADDDDDASGEDAFPWDAIFWYPTLVMNLEVKKKLPPGGCEWLFFRVQARQIRNGRLDLDVVIMDEAGDLVALANHVNLVLPVARNLGRGGGGGNQTRL